MMVPAHRNFPKPQSGALGKKKQLHVKAKADDLRRLNNRSARLHSKSFETTLRIPERKTGCHPHHQVENAAPLLAPPRLPVSDKFAIERARAKGDIHFAARDRFNNFWKLINRRRKIGIKKNRDWFRCAQQPASDRRTFAAIRKILE